MPIIAQLDSTLPRVWPGEQVALVTVTVTDLDGGSIPAGELQIGIGGYTDQPATWLTPVLARQVDSSHAAVSLLIGDTLQPVGQVWLWVQWTHGTETEQICALNKRLDFSATPWGIPGTGGTTPGASASGTTFIQETQPTVSPPWVWFKTDDQGNLLDILVEGVAG